MVNYKSLELTKTCLQLLHTALQGKAMPVFVIDNDSRDASSDERNPGYDLQDKMTALNYKIACLSARKIFTYLDHIQSGTASAIGGYSDNHRRIKMYNQITG